eukprot:m.175548 g.175548  ORF g.175548 m.175548 type:complete len:848 (-) comp13518_c2_seq4:577-3120(-)
MSDSFFLKTALVQDEEKKWKNFPAIELFISPIDGISFVDSTVEPHQIVKSYSLTQSFECMVGLGVGRTVRLEYHPKPVLNSEPLKKKRDVYKLEFIDVNACKKFVDVASSLFPVKYAASGKEAVSMKSTLGPKWKTTNLNHYCSSQNEPQHVETNPKLTISEEDNDLYYSQFANDTQFSQSMMGENCYTEGNVEQDVTNSTSTAAINASNVLESQPAGIQHLVEHNSPLCDGDEDTSMMSFDKSKLNPMISTTLQQMQTGTKASTASTTATTITKLKSTTALTGGTESTRKATAEPQPKPQPQPPPSTKSQKDQTHVESHPSQSASPLLLSNMDEEVSSEISPYLHIKQKNVDPPIPDTPETCMATQEDSMQTSLSPHIPLQLPIIKDSKQETQNTTAVANLNTHKITKFAATRNNDNIDNDSGKEKMKGDFPQILLETIPMSSATSKFSSIQYDNDNTSTISNDDNNNKDSIGNNKPKNDHQSLTTMTTGTNSVQRNLTGINTPKCQLLQQHRAQGEGASEKDQPSSFGGLDLESRRRKDKLLNRLKLWTPPQVEGKTRKTKRRSADKMKLPTCGRAQAMLKSKQKTPMLSQSSKTGLEKQENPQKKVKIASTAAENAKPQDACGQAKPSTKHDSKTKTKTKAERGGKKVKQSAGPKRKTGQKRTKRGSGKMTGRRSKPKSGKKEKPRIGKKGKPERRRKPEKKTKSMAKNTKVVTKPITKPKKICNPSTLSKTQELTCAPSSKTKTNPNLPKPPSSLPTIPVASVQQNIKIGDNSVNDFFGVDADEIRNMLPSVLQMPFMESLLCYCEQLNGGGDVDINAVLQSLLRGDLSNTQGSFHNIFINDG